MHRFLHHSSEERLIEFVTRQIYRYGEEAEQWVKRRLQNDEIWSSKNLKDWDREIYFMTMARESLRAYLEGLEKYHEELHGRQADLIGEA